MQNATGMAVSMPMFTGGLCDIHQVVVDIEGCWGLKVDELQTDGQTATMSIQGVMIAIMLMPMPIPTDELKPLYSHNYMWKSAAQDILNHTHHAVVSVMGAKDNVHAYRLMTLINTSILRSCSWAIGVYQGSATLLLPKELYCSFAKLLEEGSLPVGLWIYVGVVGNGQRTSIYTYGLCEFGRMELEVINSVMPPNDLHAFILFVLAYLLEYDVYLQDGESIGFSADDKIMISQSKGVHLDGQTLKLILKQD